MSTTPYGSWRSPLSAERICAGSLRLSQPRLDQGELYWLEGRPAEGGRQAVMRARPGGRPESVSPDDVSVRSRVHEYGGGDYTVRDGVWVASRDADQRVVCGRVGGPLRELTDGTARHADFELSPDGRFVVAVEERHAAQGPPTNQLVAIPLDGGAPIPLVSDFDFVSFPRFSPAGDQLAFTAWNHPDMPWDATELWCMEWGEHGPGSRVHVAGGSRGRGESIFQPGFSPRGRLTWVSDRSGWWNLEQLRDGERVALCPRASEFGRPQWVFALSTWDFVDEHTILCVEAAAGRQRLARLDLRSGALRALPLPYDAYDGVRVQRGRAALIAASPTAAAAVGVLDLAGGGFTPVRESLSLSLEPAWLAVPEALEFETGDGERAHAFLYRPTHPSERAAPGERPPLLVKGHGGPTGAASTALQPGIQYWTSRGFALMDVNYRGSSGYGRAYRDRLRGGWGVVDVADCVDAARFAAAQGLADASQLAISGGSAGGYTALCALTFHDLFGAGASHYGIADLEALARDTHKFEARYLDRLVGPYPERRDLYVARSPIHAADRLSCPVIFFQGLDDRVVPPNQAEAMVAALARHGIPHAYVPFAGEGHGFRRAENQRTALEGELYFYGRVFGFAVDVAPEGVTIRGLSRNGASRMPEARRRRS